jgi:hypothetical protein
MKRHLRRAIMVHLPGKEEFPGFYTTHYEFMLSKSFCFKLHPKVIVVIVTF